MPCPGRGLKAKLKGETLKTEMAKEAARTGKGGHSNTQSN